MHKLAKPHQARIYTCPRFEEQGDAAAEWYQGILKSFGLNLKDTLFDEFGTDEAARAPRLLWLAFLHHWVSTGEIE